MHLHCSRQWFGGIPAHTDRTEDWGQDGSHNGHEVLHFGQSQIGDLLGHRKSRRFRRELTLGIVEGLRLIHAYEQARGEH